MLRFGAQPRDISPNGERVRDRAAVGFDLSEAAEVSFSMIDSRGRRGAPAGRRPPAGGRRKYRFRWDGRDDDGRVVPDGVYRLRVGREEGRVVDSIKEVRVDTRPPRVSRSPARAERDPARRRARGGCASATSGPRNVAPEFRVFRTDDGAPAAVRLLPRRRARAAASGTGRVRGGRLAARRQYSFNVLVRDLAGNLSRAPAPVPEPAIAAGRALASRSRGSRCRARSGVGVRRLARGPARRTACERRFDVRALAAGLGRTIRARPAPRRPAARAHPARRAHGHLPRARRRPRRPAAAPVAAGRARPRPRGGPGRRGRSWCCPPSPGRASTSSTPTSTASPTPSRARARCPPSGRSGGGLPCRRSAPRSRRCSRFLDRERLPYDLTTDLSLARGEGPAIGNAPGVVASPARRAGSRGAARPPAARRWRRAAGWRSFGADSLRRTVALDGDRAARPEPAPPGRPLRRAHRAFSTEPPAPLREERDELGLFSGVDELFGEFSVFERSVELARRRELLTAAGREEGEPAFVGYRLGQGHRDPPGHAGVGRSELRGVRARAWRCPGSRARSLAPPHPTRLSRVAILRAVRRSWPADRGVRCSCSLAAAPCAYKVLPDEDPPEKRGSATRGVRRHRQSPSAAAPKRKVIHEPWPTFGYDVQRTQGLAVRAPPAVRRTWRIDARDTLEFPPSAALRQRLHGPAEGPLLRAQRQDRQARLQDEELQALRGVVAHARERHDLPVLHGLRGVPAGRRRTRPAS